MLKSVSTSLILRGLLAVAIGIVALAWPGVTVLALVAMFAFYAFIGAGIEAVQAFSSRSAGPVIGHLLLGLVNVVAGLVALAWPGPTALVAVLLVGTWAVIMGGVEIVAALLPAEPGGLRALFVVGGLVSTAFGVALVTHPHMGAVSLALLFGLFNVIAGTWMVADGIEVRRSIPKLQSVAAPTGTKVAA